MQGGFSSCKGYVEGMVNKPSAAQRLSYDFPKKCLGWPLEVNSIQSHPVDGRTWAGNIELQSLAIDPV